MTYLLALDQGTSSSRSIVFDEHGHIVALAQQELPQIYPKPGWVEHDLMEIWRTQLATAREVLAKAEHQGRRHTRAGHHQPARDHGALEPQDRPAGPPRHRLAGPARRATCAALREQGKESLIQPRPGC
jgi:glycerol kinase